MASNISALVVPVLLIIACIALVSNILHTNNINKTLTEEFEITEGNLALSIADATAKAGQVGSLSAQLQETAVAKAALQAEGDRLTAELATAKAATEDHTEAAVTEAAVPEAAPAKSIWEGRQ